MSDADTRPPADGGVELDEILLSLVENFAEPPSKDGLTGWWGHDTDLGDQAEAFAKAKSKLERLLTQSSQKSAMEALDTVLNRWPKQEDPATTKRFVHDAAVGYNVGLLTGQELVKEVARERIASLQQQTNGGKQA